jgi:hypothetical protein
MTLSPYLTYIKIGAVVLVLGAVSAGSFHFGRFSGELEASKAKTALADFQEAQAANTAKAVLAERDSAAAAAINDNIAEGAHDKTIESLPARIVHDPVFLRAPGDICPASGAVRDPKAEAANLDTAGRSVQPGRGIDLRPAIEALKVKYETVLADCRRLDAEWPKP